MYVFSFTAFNSSTQRVQCVFISSLSGPNLRRLPILNILSMLKIRFVRTFFYIKECLKFDH